MRLKKRYEFVLIIYYSSHADSSMVVTKRAVSIPVKDAHSENKHYVTGKKMSPHSEKYLYLVHWNAPRDLFQKRKFVGVFVHWEE